MVGISPHFSFDSRPFFGRCDQCTLWHPLRPSPWKAKFDCWWAKLGRARRGCVELCKRHVTQRRESWNLSTWNASLEEVKSTIDITVRPTVSLTYVWYFNTYDTYSQPSLPSQIIMTSKLQGRRSSLQMFFRHPKLRFTEEQDISDTRVSEVQHGKTSVSLPPKFLPQQAPGNFPNLNQLQTKTQFSVISFKSALKDPNKNGKTFEPWVLDGYEQPGGVEMSTISCNTLSRKLGDWCREQLGDPPCTRELHLENPRRQTCQFAPRLLLWLKNPKLTLLR